MITFTLYQRDRQWTATIPGAQGAGWSPWEAIAEALAVWERRGRPTPPPKVDTIGSDTWTRDDAGPDWVISSVFDRGPGEFYRYCVVGVNLNSAPNAYGREIRWDVSDIDDPRYELLPGARDTWRCRTCTTMQRGPVPARCPQCGSEHDQAHGPHASAWREAA